LVSFLAFLPQALLNVTSWNLHEMTAGRSLIRDVQVHLPRSWSTSACLRPTKPGSTVRSASSAATGAPRATADVVVGAQGFGGLAGPYAEQPEGCGRGGLRVHMPTHFVLDAGEHLDERGEFEQQRVKESLLILSAAEATGA
jgi:hypothetical protein